jgi:hypothetical protein
MTIVRPCYDLSQEQQENKGKEGMGPDTWDAGGTGLPPKVDKPGE